MPENKNLWEMSDDDLLQRSAANSAAWHEDGADKDALHAENVEINQILDQRRGESTAFDPDSGTWAPRKSQTQPAAAPAAKTEGFSYQSAPIYTSKYQGKIDELTQQIMGRAAFEYDPEKDPTYQQYKEQYTKGGQRAMQDTLGQVSARTGGLASSYAGSAAQQTYDNYMGELAGKIPELRQLAYQMYRDEGADQRANLEMLRALESGDYDKYLTLLGQYNSDRSFDYQLSRDALADERYQQEWQHKLEREGLDDDRYNQEWQHKLEREDLDDSRYQDETDYNRTQFADQQEYERAREKAQTLAAGGDFSGYKALGYTDEEIANLKAKYDASQQLLYSSGGGHKELEGGSKAYTTVLQNAAGYGEIEEAKGYLERMVDGGYITPDEAAYIYQVELGGVGAYMQSTPTTYKEFVTATGQPAIMTERDFAKRKAQGSAGVSGYADYQDYLDAMFQKYKK